MFIGTRNQIKLPNLGGPQNRFVFRRSDEKNVQKILDVEEFEDVCTNLVGGWWLVVSTHLKNNMRVRQIWVRHLPQFLEV